jgi:uroporphyrinogen decarboxylase
MHTDHSKPRERFLRTLRYEETDRRPLYLAGPWAETLARWRGEGLPAEVTDVHDQLGVKELGYRMTNITPAAGPFPQFERKTVRETDTDIFYIDGYGRTVHDFKHKATIPEWVEFPVKSPADLRRYLDEHFDVDNLDARFPDDWEAKARAAESRGDIIMIDGGCYYWTLRSIAGVDGASYLLCDAPALVEELCDRYFTVVMAGLRRAVEIVAIDAIGFGEDFAFKTGPLLSPAMFRQFILPRYARTMALAHQHGIELTWHDSDGDCRALLPDMIAAGVNSTVPCEVAANMDPVALRARFGRDLRIGGGFDKRIVAQGPAAVKTELKRLEPVIREGGFIPGIDHSVPADVSWDHYRAYIEIMVAATGMC